MTKPASIPILAVISTLPVIAACALIGATEAATCTADPSGCGPYVATIQQIGPNVVATGSGEFDLTGLTVLVSSGRDLDTGMVPSTAALSLSASPPNVTAYTGFTAPRPTNFGPGAPGLLFEGANESSGPPVEINGAVVVPVGTTSGEVLATSQDIWDNMTLDSLGVTPGTYVWTWGTAPDQSFTIAVVPGPVVGAGLPGLIAALGGLVAMARRRRKQLA